MEKNNLKNFLLLLSLLLVVSCTHKNEVLSYSGLTMGTTYSIKVINDGTGNIDRLQQKIDSVLIDVNKKMSTYIPDSELSLFNKNRDTSWIKLSDELFLQFEKALEVYKVSGGSYDITVGPLVNLWGFGPEQKKDAVPDKTKLDSAIKIIGSNKLFLDKNSKSVKKLNPMIYCDLSSIAKGFGVDKIAELLVSNGVKNYMVEIGGEVKTKGVNQNLEKWNIGIATPNQTGSVEKILLISDYAIATSGDYQNYFEENGKRYSHTIDPATGFPITHNLASVTVLSDKCMMADAFATAFDVMGTEKTLKIADSLKIPVFLIVKEKGKFKELYNKYFEKFIKAN